MDKQALAQRIKDACESSGEVSFRNDYSGRGMYGRNCVGIVSTRRECNKVIAEVINALMSSVSAEALTRGDSYKLADVEQEFEQSVELLLDSEQDSMGYGVIVYWEGLAPLEEEVLDNDGQPDEAQEWHDFDPDC